MVRVIEGVPFQYVCDIVPESEIGKPKEFMPQSKYNNKHGLSLHKHGHGPFCRFSIPNTFNLKTGVYLIVVDDEPKYVGECEDLGWRYNTGYGNISPRNCFKGGQSTNCRINNLILMETKKDSKVELFFLETDERFTLERELIRKLGSEWNRASGKMEGYKKMDKERWRVSRMQTTSVPRVGKYSRLEDHLGKSENRIERISYSSIEEILGFELPMSAHKHRAWWSNGGHSYADSWLNAGWEVSSVDLGKSVIFRRMH